MYFRTPCIPCIPYTEILLYTWIRYFISRYFVQGYCCRSGIETYLPMLKVVCKMK